MLKTNFFGLGEFLKLFLESSLLGREHFHPLSQSIQLCIISSLANLSPQRLLQKQKDQYTTRSILKYSKCSTTYHQQLESKFDFVSQQVTSRSDLGSSRLHFNYSPPGHIFNSPHIIPYIWGI